MLLNGFSWSCRQYLLAVTLSPEYPDISEFSVCQNPIRSPSQLQCSGIPCIFVFAKETNPTSGIFVQMECTTDFWNKYDKQCSRRQVYYKIGRARAVLLIQQFGKISGWRLFIIGDSNGIQVSVSGAAKLHNFLCGWEGQIKISGLLQAERL